MKRFIITFLLLAAFTLTFAQEDQTFKVNGVQFVMKFVKGGNFLMGATKEQGTEAEDKEKPAHKVTLNDFYIGQTEVTQALWMAVMDNNPSEFQCYDRPVENVTWNDCQAFITKLNAITGLKFRLPSEAEWEYAARGGAKSKRFKFAGSNSHEQVAWSADAIGKQLAEDVPYHNDAVDPADDITTAEELTQCTYIVGTKKPNELGIYDMSGNVWEWCNDFYDENYYKNSTADNPAGPAQGTYHVHRGGSWRSGAWYCRVSNRNADDPGYSYSSLGFRLAL